MEFRINGQKTTVVWKTYLSAERLHDLDQEKAGAHGGEIPRVTPRAFNIFFLIGVSASNRGMRLRFVLCLVKRRDFHGAAP